jgi:hypothetical protein
MEIEEIQVTLLPDGTVQINVQGVKGSACLEITRELEQALGGPVISRVMTEEVLDAYASKTLVQEQKQIRRRQRKG